MLRTVLPFLYSKHDISKAFLVVFSDSDGKLGKLINHLKMSKDEKVAWLKIGLPDIR